MSPSTVAQTSGWEIVSALATAAAAIVALGFAVVPSAWQRRRRAKLSVHIGRTEPHVRPVAKGLNLVAEVRLRIEVRNDGKTAARAVWVQLWRWWRSEPGHPLGADWLQLDADPLHLGWISLPEAKDRNQGPVVTIGPGGSDYAELASLESPSGRLALLVDDARLARFRLEAVEQLGTYKVEIVVGAENCEPHRQTIEFTVDGKNFFAKIALAEPPTLSRHVGLFSLFDGVDDQQPDEEGADLATTATDGLPDDPEGADRP